MKRWGILVCILVGISIFFSGIIISANSNPDVYVVEYHLSVSGGSADYLIKSLDEAVDSGAKMVIIDLDTYGGLVDQAKRISDALISLPIPSVIYINTNAQSAGVLISISGEEIYMSPKASIGSAETIPNEEKVLSMWKSWLRGVAEQRGYNPLLVEAMADKRIEIEGITRKDELVNLTAKEAVDLKLSRGIIDSIEELIEEKGYDVEKAHYVNPSFFNRLISFLSSPSILVLMFMLGTGAMLVEIAVPGFGLFGVSSILFYAMLLVGLTRGGELMTLPIVLLVVGIILLIVEAFIPGFGIAGISGLALIAYAIYRLFGLTVGLITVLVMLVLFIIIISILTKKGENSAIFKRLGLGVKLDDKGGYIPHGKPAIEVGEHALSASELRPTGYINYGGDRYDAIAEEGSYIGKGNEVVVIRIEGAKIIVREVEK
ncbi:MAG: hypothetical protein GXZ11_01905 [Tissierellia bacterium]|nr:hypothetical protein [Tissierellia bacterium]